MRREQINVHSKVAVVRVMVTVMELGVDDE